MQNRKKKLSFAANVLKFAFLAEKYLAEKKQRRCRVVSRLCTERNRLGFFGTTFKYIKANDPELFFLYTRMSLQQYNLLLSLIENSLKKNSNRKPISPECRLAVTLVYLSQGVSIHYLASSFRMGVSTVRKIICEVCEILWKLLSPVYMPPFNLVDWYTTAEEFYKRWQMPNCIGSVGGKHIKIKCTPNSGSQYFNNKGDFSFGLVGLCDADYRFTAVDVGAYGSQSDDDIFRLSTIGRKIFNNDLQVPSLIKLPNSNKSTPLYFVGDNSFPLRPNLLRPYPGLLVEQKKDNFNKRLYRARRVLENTFGILCTRWRILLSEIEFSPENAGKLVLACTVLHNFVKVTSYLYDSHKYCPPTYIDRLDEDGNIIPGQWRQHDKNLASLNIGSSHSTTRDAIAVRETLAEYFLNAGNI